MVGITKIIIRLVHIITTSGYFVPLIQILVNERLHMSVHVLAIIWSLRQPLQSGVQIIGRDQKSLRTRDIG